MVHRKNSVAFDKKTEIETFHLVLESISVAGNEYIYGCMINLKKGDSEPTSTVNLKKGEMFQTRKKDNGYFFLRVTDSDGNDFRRIYLPGSEFTKIKTLQPDDIVELTKDSQGKNRLGQVYNFFSGRIKVFGIKGPFENAGGFTGKNYTASIDEIARIRSLRNNL